MRLSADFTGVINRVVELRVARLVVLVICTVETRGCRLFEKGLKIGIVCQSVAYELIKGTLGRAAPCESHLNRGWSERYAPERYAGVERSAVVAQVARRCDGDILACQLLAAIVTGEVPRAEFVPLFAIVDVAVPIAAAELAGSVPTATFVSGRLSCDHDER